MNALSKLKVKIFVDGAEIGPMKEAYRQDFVKGFTTNPTLMKKAGITDYEAFAREVLKAIPDKPISFEVFSDEFEEMGRQARKIAGWGKNIYIKIPITNTKRESSVPLIRELSGEGLPLNVTAILTLEQVKDVAKVLNPRAMSIVSVFAGRIADTGVDPVPMMRESVGILKPNRNAELLWASSRELLNALQADACGCHIITMTNDIVKKLSMIGKDLSELSLETVQMFYKDAQAAGFRL